MLGSVPRCCRWLGSGNCSSWCHDIPVACHYRPTHWMQAPESLMRCPIPTRYHTGLPPYPPHSRWYPGVCTPVDWCRYLFHDQNRTLWRHEQHSQPVLEFLCAHECCHPLPAAPLHLRHQQWGYLVTTQTVDLIPPSHVYHRFRPARASSGRTPWWHVTQSIVSNGSSDPYAET